jgi:hypothetical protein
MTRHWFKRRLTHTCTVTRDVGTARNSIGEVTAVSSAVSTAQICRLVDQIESYAAENQTDTTQRVQRLMLPTDADVQRLDTITAVKDAEGSTLAVGPVTVEEVLKRRDIYGELHHLSAELERINIT